MRKLVFSFLLPALLVISGLPPAAFAAPGWETVNDELAFAKNLVENPSGWYDDFLSRGVNDPETFWRAALREAGIDNPENDPVFDLALKALRVEALRREISKRARNIPAFHENRERAPRDRKTSARSPRESVAYGPVVINNSPVYGAPRAFAGDGGATAHAPRVPARSPKHEETSAVMTGDAEALLGRILAEAQRTVTENVPEWKISGMFGNIPFEMTVSRETIVPSAPEPAREKCGEVRPSPCDPCREAVKAPGDSPGWKEWIAGLVRSGAKKDPCTTCE